MIWKEVLVGYESDLREASVSDPELSARRIVEEASGYHGAEWELCVDQPVTQKCLASADAMVSRRKQGEPLQYVVGNWNFRNLDIFVDSRVLIPRPETEEVAGWAIAEAQRFVGSPGLNVVDLGTGSGVIGLSVALEVPQARVWLSDQSADAIQVARANLAGLGSAGIRVSLSQGDWFEALDLELLGSVNVLVSNPPYCSPDDNFGESVLEWEPSSALLAGPTGREDIDHIIDESPKWLRPTGSLVLEMAPDQVHSVSDYARRLFEEVEICEDMAGRLRCVIARRPKSS